MSPRTLDSFSRRQDGGGGGGGVGWGVGGGGGWILNARESGHPVQKRDLYFHTWQPSMSAKGKGRKTWITRCGKIPSFHLDGPILAPDEKAIEKA